jgi:hypothetical protein
MCISFKEKPEKLFSSASQCGVKHKENDRANSGVRATPVAPTVG